MQPNVREKARWKIHRAMPFKMQKCKKCKGVIFSDADSIIEVKVSEAVYRILLLLVNDMEILLGHLDA